MKNKIDVSINNTPLKSLKDLIKLNLSLNEKQALLKQLTKIMETIGHQPLPDNQYELEKENKLLKEEIKKLNFSKGINQTLLGFHESNLASAAADLIINPNPIEIHGTKLGKGVDYVVSLMNILGITNCGRAKNIYLKEAICPKEGGQKQSKIETNNQDLNFEKLLRSLQNNGHHLIKANRSEAINIYHYNLIKQKTFVLNIDAPKEFPKELQNIKTDKNFDAALYHTRLMEIDRLKKYHHDFAINLKKIKEITRYKNSTDVT